jgi:hypothetical protein
MENQSLDRMAIITFVDDPPVLGAVLAHEPLDPEAAFLVRPLRPMILKSVIRSHPAHPKLLEAIAQQRGYGVASVTLPPEILLPIMNADVARRISRPPPPCRCLPIGPPILGQDGEGGLPLTPQPVHPSVLHLHAERGSAFNH